MAAQVSTHSTLLNRLATGSDATAWSEFVARYGDLIRGFAQQRGLQASDCDDIVQDVLMKLTRAMPRFQYDPQRGKFRGYLKTVVIHAIATKMSQKRNATPVGNIDDMTRTADADPQVDELWETQWRRYHLRQAMRTAAAEFNERDLRAFQAYGVEGHDARQTAAELDMSVDQVYAAKSRILKRLSELIAAQVHEEG